MFLINVSFIPHLNNFRSYYVCSVYQRKTMAVITAKRLMCFWFGMCTTTLVHNVHAEIPKLDVIHEWSQLEFDYPTEHDRQTDIDNGVFQPGIPAPIDVDVHYPKTGANKRIFISMPRFQPGMPIALGTVTEKKRGSNPIIAPYPDWEWHRKPERCSPERIVSVFRVMIDECDRLWVLDCGRLLNERVCPPQILAFDLKTDKLIHRYEIPESLLEGRSTLVTPIVDIRDGCENTFIYVADCVTYSIIVYDLARNQSWKATDKTMYPYPNYGTFNIAGDSFDLMDGVLGMTLSSYTKSNDKILYYHAMSSPTENWVLTSHLRNQSMFANNPESSPHVFHTYRGRRTTQSAAEAIDKDGIIYFGLMSQIKIACFNTKGEYGDPASMDIVADDPVTLQFASGMKVINNKNGTQELWTLTSRFQKIGAGTLNPSEVNFRVLAGKIPDLLYGTRCKRSLKTEGSNYLPHHSYV